MPKLQLNDRNFLAWLTIAMIIASLFIFRSYLHYLLVAAVLALSTSHVFTSLASFFADSKKMRLLNKSSDGIAAFILTCFFLLMIFGPMLYFVSMLKPMNPCR